jgi:hypothetical protein
MNNRVKEVSIEKYYNALLDLNSILTATDRMSMDAFCAKNNISKNLPKVLQKAGIIKCKRKGKYSLWEWTSIDPTKHMAFKCLQKLGDFNPPRKSEQLELNMEENVATDVKVVTRRRRKKVVEPLPIKENKKVLFSLFWGFFKVEIC